MVKEISYGIISMPGGDRNHNLIAEEQQNEVLE